MEKFYSIAIDGPSGAGKSTIAKAAAKALGFVYLDTGAIYRTVAWHITMMGIGPKDTDHVPMLLDDANIKIDFREDGQHMILNGKDITGEIRTPEISACASMTPTYFSALFRQMNGLPLWEYITIKRVERAIGLLRDTDLTKLDIAGMCGFSSPSNFYRAFAQVTGKTPSHYTGRRTEDGGAPGAKI